MSSHQYHRNTDPKTSRLAAEFVNDKYWTNKHLETLRVLLDLDEATDEEIMTEAVARGIVERHEQARRLIRTIRRTSVYVCPVIANDTNESDDDGQKVKVNPFSGRLARVWTLSAAGIRYTLETPLSR